MNNDPTLQCVKASCNYTGLQSTFNPSPDDYHDYECPNCGTVDPIELPAKAVTTTDQQLAAARKLAKRFRDFAVHLYISKAVTESEETQRICTYIPWQKIGQHDLALLARIEELLERDEQTCKWHEALADDGSPVWASCDCTSSWLQDKPVFCPQCGGRVQVKETK